LSPPADDGHECGWKAYAKALDEQLAEMREQLATLERRVLGKKSEKRKSGKMPPPIAPKSDPAAAAEKRKNGNPTTSGVAVGSCGGRTVVHAPDDAARGAWLLRRDAAA
jgi:hypothetical protein